MQKRVNFYQIFKINSDKSIEPIRVVRIGGVQFGPGVRFGKGVFFGNLNLLEHIGKDFLVEEVGTLLIVRGIY